MHDNLKTKTIIIIGGTKGIGRTISAKFLDCGYNVISGSRKEHNPFNNDNFYSLKLNVINNNEFENFFLKAKKISKKITTLINNVGVSEWKPIEKINKDFLDKMFLTNIYSTFFSIKCCIKNFDSVNSIINISSIAGKRGSINNSAYCSTKFALNGLTQSLAKELGQRDIRINSICPVLIDTPGLRDAMKKKYSPGYHGFENFIKAFKETQVALNELPTSEDVANMCIFLSSSSSKSITGQNINLDSGVFPQ
ncbi:MAG: short-chain dehydrogenase [Porticoccus sp.]|nr:short-chain dehydrogenase [Porticoccus sp.]